MDLFFLHWSFGFAQLFALTNGKTKKEKKGRDDFSSRYIHMILYMSKRFGTYVGHSAKLNVLETQLEFLNIFMYR